MGAGVTTPLWREGPGGERLAEAKERIGFSPAALSVCRGGQAGLPSAGLGLRQSGCAGGAFSAGRFFPAPPPRPSAESHSPLAASPPEPSPLARGKRPYGSPSRPTLRAAAWRAASPPPKPPTPRPLTRLGGLRGARHPFFRRPARRCCRSRSPRRARPLPRSSPSRGNPRCPRRLVWAGVVVVADASRLLPRPTGGQTGRQASGFPPPPPPPSPVLSKLASAAPRFTPGHQVAASCTRCRSRGAGWEGRLRGPVVGPAGTRRGWTLLWVGGRTPG